MAQRGRPKTFDRETALDAAMLLFWNRGFEQTCVDDLADAMGIQTSSLYSSFGDKETLFLEAVEHYRTGRGSVFDAAVMEGKTAKEGFENLFRVTATELTRKDQPSGCMLCLALPTCSPKYDHLQQELDRLRALSDTILLKRLENAVQDKEIPKSTDLRSLVAYFRTTLLGMSLQARAGASKETLLKIGKLALQVWPSPPNARA
ncbi:TetR/AcrR family transcriptional regulator [Terriglobus albidus]|uniref:TetR/AcrR family transcriptional regulator n=1 Tax=Terriglobus albidus TaxID=1592106 RepID=UPI0021DFEA41|nr:TetR/AcrR family transcriptional regulator [Terriglobus albidus]